MGLFHSLGLLIHRVESGQTEICELVEVKELGVGEQSEFSVEVVRGLLLLLLQSLVVRRRNRVQIIDVLGEVGGTTPVVVGHIESAGVVTRELIGSMNEVEVEVRVARRSMVESIRGWMSNAARTET